MPSAAIRSLYVEMRAIQIGIWEAETTKDYKNYEVRLNQARSLFNEWIKADLGRDPTKEDRKSLSWLICNLQKTNDPKLEERAEQRWMEIQDSADDAAWRRVEECVTQADSTGWNKASPD